MKTFPHTVAAVLFIIVSVAQTQAAPGDFDTTFGSGGKRLVEIGDASNDTAQAVVRDAAGNTYVAGSSNAQGSSNFAVIKLDAGGNLVDGFGTRGKALVDLGVASDDLASAIALDASGNLLVAGQSDADGAYEFAAIKLDASGHLVVGFGNAGKVLLPNSPGGNDACGSVVLDAAGDVYLIGRGIIEGKQAMKIAKLDPSSIW